MVPGDEQRQPPPVTGGRSFDAEASQSDSIAIAIRLIFDPTTSVGVLLFGRSPKGGAVRFDVEKITTETKTPDCFFPIVFRSFVEFLACP